MYVSIDFSSVWSPAPAPLLDSASSTSNLPQTTRSLSVLLASVRALHTATPAESAQSILSRLEWPQDQDPVTAGRQGVPLQPPALPHVSAPRPPPPVLPLLSKLLHDSRPPPHPHVLTALLLQAIFLGATALGLLRRGEHAVASIREPSIQASDVEVVDEQCEGQTTQRMRERETAATNLLLSSYAVAPQSRLQRELLRHVGEDDVLESATPSEALRPIATILAHFSSPESAVDDGKVSPDRWTVLALFSFISPPAATSNKSDHTLSKTPFELARPILALWAWRTYQHIQKRIDDSSRSQYNESCDRAIVDAHLALLLPTSPHYIPFDSAPCDALFASLSTTLIETDPARAPPPYQLFDLGLAALARQEYPTVFRLLSPESLLPPPERIKLCLLTLQTFSADEDWRCCAEAVCQVGQWLAMAINEGLAAGLALPRVEEGLILLLTGFGIDIALEPLVVDVTLGLLHHPVALADTFTLSLITTLVRSRNPRLALCIFDALPEPARSLDHYNAILRSHHAPTSDIAWARLLAHPILKLTIDSYYARLCAHSSKAAPNLAGARDDLRRMQQQGLPRSLKLWNKLLNLVGRVGSDREFFKEVARMRSAGFEGDQATTSILFQREFSLQKRASRSSVERSRNFALARESVLPLGPQGRRRGRNQLEALNRSLIDLAGRGDCGTCQVNALVTSQNIALKGITRWSREVGVEQLEQIADRVVGGSSPVDRKEFDLVRRPAYKMIIKGLQNRGAWNSSINMRAAMNREARAMRIRSRSE